MKHLFMLRKWYLLLVLCIASLSPIFGQNLGSSMEVCSVTTTLTAPSGTSGTWSTIQGGTVPSNSTTTTITVTNSAGVNIYKWTPSVGASGFVTVTYNQVSKPVITVQNNEKCLSTFAIYSAASQTGNPSFQWTILTADGSPSIAKPNQVSTFINNVSGVVTVILKAQLGSCFQLDTANVVSLLLTPIVAQKEVTVCPGGFTQLKASVANPNGSTRYAWSGQISSTINTNNLIKGADTDTPTLVYTNISGQAIFTVQATNSICTTSSISETVLVTFSQNSIKADAGADVKYCYNANNPNSKIVLQASGKGSFEWDNGGAKSYDATLVVNPSTNTTYLLKYTDIYGCSATDAVTVEVISTTSPMASITITTSPICQGQTIDLVATGGTSYQWTGKGNFSNKNSANPKVSFQKSGNIYVTANNGVCSTSASIEIVVDSEFNIFGKDVSSAGGNDGELNVELPASKTILWSTGEDKQVISNLVAGHYTATVKDKISGCSFTNEIEVFEPLVSGCDLTADFTLETVDNQVYVYNQTVNGTKFTWDFGDGAFDYSTTTATHTYEYEGKYNICLTAYSSNTCISKLCKTVSIGTTNCKAEIGYTVNTNNPKEIRFVGNTSSNIQKWYWEFGDGTTSDVQNPVHTYNSENRYSVALRSVNGCVANDIKEINIGTENVRASFVTFLDATGSVATVSFSDMSLGNIVSWSWNFGDGSTSTLANPIHIYPLNKNYIVTLVVQNKGDKISTYSAPVQTGTNQVVAKYDFSVNSNTNAVSFVNKSTGLGIWSPCLWMFDDGGISILENPSHLYTKAGLYKVTLIVGNATYTKFDKITKEIQIGNIDCSAKFAAFVNPDTRIVKFVNTGIGSNLLYNWEFGDNSILDQANPVHSYATEAFYNVRLKVRTNDNTCMDSYEATILVGNRERYNKSDFIFRVNDRSAKFMNLTQGNISNYVWNFGDGSSTSTEEMPAHIFSKYGVYNVCLTVSTGTASHINCKDVRVVPELTAMNYVQSDFDKVIDISKKTVNFFDKSKGNVNKWEWNFGDGKSSTSTLQNPIYTYNTAGYYLVSLTSSNSAGLKNTNYKLINVGAENKLQIQVVLIPTPTSKKAGGYPLDMTGAAFGDPAKMVWDFGDGSPVEETTTTPNHVYTTAGTYKVCVTAIDPMSNQTVTSCETITVDQTVDIPEVKGENPFTLVVAPNPAKDIVSVSYNLPQTSTIKLSLFDIAGKELVTLQNAKFEKGNQEFKFDVSQLVQGVYYIHLQSDKEVTTKKIVISR